MKKIILLFILAVIAQVSIAQRTAYHAQPEQLFNQGKEMFLEGNYEGAKQLLEKFVAGSDDAYLKEEAAYMMAVSSFRSGDDNSGNMLEAFLDTYPETVHRYHVNFLIGSYYFDKKEWQAAGERFNQADLDYLILPEQEDYSFRLAYTQLQLGNKEEATRLFGLLSQNSGKYRDAAAFYLGYIEYSNGNYTEALRRFERLKDHPEYSEEVAFYTAQATFFDGRIEEAVRLSEAFVHRYPASEHLTEAYRVLGNGYYRLGQASRAVPYYENYLAGVNKPLRGDAYFLGLSYFETGNYSRAVQMFQQAVGESDELSQNAQLQLGQTYLRLNQKQSAQMAFEAASRDNFNPQVRETAMFNYALLAHETNFSVFSESITLFENFLREFPNSPYKDQVNDILAETFLTTKDYQAALNAINRITNPGRRILEAKQMVLFQLGAQAFINGNMNEAVQHFNNSIGLGNQDTKALNNTYFWRGETYYRMGNYSNAANDFRQFTQNATSADENYALGWYNLGYALFKQQQYNQAVNAFQQYIAAEKTRNRPEYADALNRVGDSYYFNRSFSEAERYYAQAADINPSSADYAAYQRAFVMGLQHNYQGKITALDNLMRNYPNSQYFDDALYEKSRALTMLNRESEAIAVLQRLVSDFPKSPLASQGGVQLGQLYYNTENYQQSIAAYKNVITNFPGSDDARNALISLETVYRDMNDIDSYVRYANSLPGGMRITPSRQDSLTYLAAESVYMRGNRADAESAMTKYIQSYPNGAYSSDAHYYLGVIADERKNPDLALSHFRKVIDAGNIKFLDNALIYTSQTEYRNGNFRQALADYSRLATSARNATNKQMGQMGVVRTQSQLGSYHEAARAATDLLSNDNLSPETVIEARYLRGKAYQQVNETDNAMADFQFVANDTRSIYGAEAQFILADAYYRWKSYDRAEAQVKEFMQKGTPHQYWMARALIVLSDTYLAKGDEFQARQYLESLKSNYKGDEADIQQMINERLLN
ncbi:tetratricopeptide repeat protein [uncultured Proteiniphilum sp.]|uniref:tetratricopeptide repeat protein n=1 Tax=uncultured Proteiniphilum sp. TaxID=497637 RepID=UPI002605C47F|nr:tetratricopeptide repeat protein [uncultured Proteiniphilum sp.]